MLSIYYEYKDEFTISKCLHVIHKLYLYTGTVMKTRQIYTHRVHDILSDKHNLQASQRGQIEHNVYTHLPSSLFPEVPPEL